MTHSFTSHLTIGAFSLLAMAAAPASLAQVPPPVVPAPEPPAPTAMTTPPLTGPLVANPNPIHLDITPFFGPVYVTGAVSGLGMAQTNRVLGVDRRINLDISNAQVALQTTEGLFQFFVQPGIYSFPTLGLPYRNVTDMPTSVRFFGGLPIAWGKLALTDFFSIQGGKLPTLIGAEYMFTFQNMNIERGLLWAQENIVNKGVQANLTTGPVAWSLSLNDGFYTDQYNYLTGAATWTINPSNSVIISGGGALARNTATGTPALPQYNNSTIITASYTYNEAPWTVTPYVQYTHVDADPGLGILGSASTIGGAILASYKFNDFVSLAGRWEYIDSSGTGMGAGLLGYGPGSAAMSFTLTPTLQIDRFFLRGETSVVQLYNTTAGLAFGSGNARTQARFLVETGVVF